MRIRRWFRRSWTPFDSRGKLRPSLFTRDGFVPVGALQDDTPAWPTKIASGLAFMHPVLPNAPGFRGAPWWRRLLRRFGR